MSRHPTASLSKEEAHGTSEEKVERAYSFDRSPEAGGS